MKKTYAIIVAALVVFSISAQQDMPCGNHQQILHLEEKFPGYRASMDQQYLNLVNNSKFKLRLSVEDTIYTVRVVVHVVYNNSAQNVSDSLIRSQLRVLNESFRKRHADTNKTRSIFKSRSQDVGINFVLADKDPNGNPTTGIIRKSTSVTTFGGSANYDKQKRTSQGGDDAWDPARYMNIWICNMQASSSSVVLGYATPPYGHMNWPSSSWPTSDALSGITIHYTVFGYKNPLATGPLFGNSTEGRTCVHEVGHYLGLRHIWGDDDMFGGNTCTMDDYIDDTPLQGPRSYFDCNLGVNSCSQGNPDEPDMIENYMDYSRETCQNMFTKEQIDVMRLALVKYRYGIIEQKEFVPITRTDSFKIYWSSTSEGINIIRPLGNKNYDLKIDLVDYTGRVLMSNYQLPKSSSMIDTRFYRPGIYMLRVRNLEGKILQNEKLLIYR